MNDDLSDINLDDPEHFLEQLHTLVDESVEKNIQTIEEKYGDEAIEAYRGCVSDIVTAFASADLFNGDWDEDNTVMIAFQALRICKMFLYSFDAAYTTTATRLNTRKSLEDQFKL